MLRSLVGSEMCIRDRVIAQLVGKELDGGHDLLTSVKLALTQLEGTWGLAVMSENCPGEMIVARNGSPIVIGLAEGCTYVASETSAFMRHTKNFISLKDGEIAVITADGLALDQEQLEGRVEQAQGDAIETSPAPYPHWTIKEIMEQPVAASRALGYGGRLHPEGGVKLGGLEANQSKMLGISNLLIAACGTSHFAGLYGARLMRQLGAFDTVSNFDAAEVTPETFPMTAAGLLVISQSGETRDVIKVLDIAESGGLPCFSIVNAVGSMIARSTGCGVYSHAGREQAVASTKAFLTQVTVMSLVAAWFSERREQAGALQAGGLAPGASYAARRDRLVESLHRLPSYVGMTLQPKSRDLCREVAHKIKDKETLFVLGKGFAEPIALEGALKIKEITYAHAEGYSGGALKHGPFALIEQGTPIIMLIMDDHHAPNMRTAAEEVRARGAHTIVITDKRSLAHGVADDVIVIPHNGMLSAVLAVIPLQLIAYEMALAKGINPDKPRNLAKAVTTD
eukprot:TRINITY_DN22866_c0_g1_i2.p1 TRINITY_DN22866_c0_g1~~TRINITY_DN22866_c0_g1_i2.p1  ORF type:complete len:555 (+),score=136.00 TRINITY_DN22866_c0_g1_i2:133-1665(+)